MDSRFPASRLAVVNALLSSADNNVRCMHSGGSGHHQGGTGRDSAAAPSETVHRADLGLAALAELANRIAFVLDRDQMNLQLVILCFPRPARTGVGKGTMGDAAAKTRISI